MKKGLLMIAVIATVGFVSCKKDYTCTCTYTSGSTTSTSTSTITNAKKKDAEAACNSLQTTGGASYSCVLN